MMMAARPSQFTPKFSASLSCSEKIGMKKIPKQRKMEQKPEKYFSRNKLRKDFMSYSVDQKYKSADDLDLNAIW